ncbi:hypothetical protein [Streptomyces sp. NPDC097619]|uniref:hypothetical protein n=1 Tax=Streptomyces sp. NPDC097619 TaxID=3157228 RepID=UPI0033209944
MAIADDLRKTLTDPTPLYFAAGTADLAVQQARKVPGLIDQLRAEAPGRIDAVRNTDPKVVQDRAKEAQAVVTAKVAEVLGALDGVDVRKALDSADLKKLGEQAQDLALRGVGVAAEYAVRAKETYDKVAEHGEQAVKQWRGEVADEIIDIAEVVEAPRPTPVAEPAPAAEATSTEAPAEAAPAEEAPAKPAAKRAARKTTAKKTAAAEAAPEQPAEKPAE